MGHKVTLIPGDGIGPEVMIAAKRVIDESGAKIDWEVVQVGKLVQEKQSMLIPQNVIQSIKKNKVAFKGPVTTPIGKGYRSLNVAIRNALDLYANVRIIKSYEGIESKYPNVDLVVIREITEDVYGGIEHMVGEDGAESIKITTRKASERIAAFAFEYAKVHGRKKITVAHKANIMQYTDGLFLESVRKIASKYKEIEFEEIIVDTLGMKLVQNPHNYDILLMPNLYGDLISSMATGFVGGIGIAPGASIGKNISIFEPVHGSAPEMGGKQIANPTGAILSGVMMLKHLGEFECAEKIEKAISEVIKEHKGMTPDIGGKNSTMDFAKIVIEKMKVYM